MAIKNQNLNTRPHRVQRKRTKGWKMPANTVSVCRPGRWGNPFAIGTAAQDVPESFHGQIAQDASEAIKLYESMIQQTGLPKDCDLSELRGKNLACWCPIGAPCHADILLQLANSSIDQSTRPEQTATHV